MDAKETANRLNSLIKLDIDAVSAYNQTIDQVQESDIRERFIQYRDDHERHIAVLSEVVRSLGEKPPERSKDFRGFLIQGFTTIMGLGSTQPALQAMENNEKLTNKKYKEATGWDLDLEMRKIIDGAYEDEQKHLAYIQQKLGHEVDVERYHPA